MFDKLYWKIQDVKQTIYVKKYKKKYPDYIDDKYNVGPLKFVWGIKSSDCFISGDANAYTMNDIEIDYDRENKQYMLSFETIYWFKTKQDECEYYKWLLDKFTQYMNDNKLSTTQYWSCVIISNTGINFRAGTIEELYIQFKIFVIGYCAVLQEDHKHTKGELAE